METYRSWAQEVKCSINCSENTRLLQYNPFGERAIILAVSIYHKIGKIKEEDSRSVDVTAYIIFS